MKTQKLIKKKSRGGARSGCGRKRTTDPNEWQYITCLLKRDTVQALKQAGGEFYGRYLQAHLEKYPIDETDTVTASQQGQAIAVETVRAAAPGVSAHEFVLPNMRPRSDRMPPQTRAHRSKVE